MSTNTMFLITYVLGYLWFWRYHVGYLLAMEKKAAGYIDNTDIVMYSVFGTIIACAWPFTVGGRTVHVLSAKYLDPELLNVEKIFPGPKKVETASERKERIEEENQKTIESRRKEINDYERENSMELTRWTD